MVGRKWRIDECKKPLPNEPGGIHRQNSGVTLHTSHCQNISPTLNIALPECSVGAGPDSKSGSALTDRRREVLKPTSKHNDRDKHFERCIFPFAFPPLRSSSCTQPASPAGLRPGRLTAPTLDKLPRRDTQSLTLTPTVRLCKICRAFVFGPWEEAGDTWIKMN